ncbi:MAG: respiratory nitrate reductase subunit gamma [Rhodospirillales bacterium]|nr:respiratory nitrate reductase subunit gamma [Alphaproteobacteria bacterium]MCB9986808.1 respiratory nitrate reductase subunit gamma [Rhodospirillales bacterium]USO08427.1 MAG: respiratory nitrate reductase subunit gamma [Rhodospirillales bacterium]
MNFFLFQILPYLSLGVCILGCMLRFDRDPYSWRSKSSQLLRRKQLMMGSVFFHVGILIVLAGHAVGLLTPVVVFDALGIAHGTKQLLAMVVGGAAGMLCLIGLLMLLHRRLYDQRIRATSSVADIAVLFLLLAQLLLGLCTIPVSMGHLDGHEMVKFMEWAQHIVTFRAGASDFIADVHPVFKLHLTLGMLLFIAFPFTRLVHALSAPLGFVFRPWQIVRRREV